MRTIAFIVLFLSTSFIVYQASNQHNQWPDRVVQTTEHPEESPQKSSLPSSQNIILNALPKSGSTYMAKTLENSLGYTHKTFSAEYIPVDQINFYLLAGFYWEGGKLSKQHFDASDLNIRILKMFTKKMVLHLRDPRDVLLSWVHHMNFVKKQGLDLFYFDPQPPAGYYDLSFSEQIDWNIENFLPNSIDWINKWLKVKEQEDLSEDGLNILITTHDELVKDELGLYSKILSFYGIPSNQLKFEPAKKNDEVRFRHGTKGEWHTALTERQKKRVSEIIPDSLLKRFNWI